MLLRSLLVLLLFAAADLGSTGVGAATPRGHDTGKGWIALFDGRSLDGWTAGENKDSCRVEDGAIVVGGGERSHLFYSGPVQNHDFKNFELKARVKTEPGSNSGIFFHTEYQETDWPKKGYEAQVNNTQEDWRKTGSLYDVEDVRESPVEDGEWFDYHILVRGRRIVLKVNGRTTVDYMEPDQPVRSEERSGRVLSSGTIALQAHDPGSTVYYRDLRVKPLPEEGCGWGGPAPTRSVGRRPPRSPEGSLRSTPATLVQHRKCALRRMLGEFRVFDAQP